LAPVRLETASPWVPLSIAVGAGLLVAMLGARSAARRAGRVGPIDALREAALEPPRIGPVRVVFGLLFMAGAIVMLTLIRPSTGEGAVPLAMFTPMVMVIGLTLLAPLVVPWISRLWALPLVAWTRVSGRLARSNVVAAPRRSASLAAPILSISAIAGSMVLSLSFAADSAAATIRDTLRAPVVVTEAADLSTVPGVGVVDVELGPQAVFLSLRGDVVEQRIAQPRPGKPEAQVVVFDAAKAAERRQVMRDRECTVAHLDVDLEECRAGGRELGALLRGRGRAVRNDQRLGHGQTVRPGGAAPATAAHR